MTRDPRSSIGPTSGADAAGRAGGAGAGGFGLPVPDEAAATQVEAVAGAIRARLEAGGGWIDFAQYMSLALYAPGLGYYSAGAAKFGRDGDFVTAPEISDLFAEVLAGQFAALLAECGAAGAEAEREAPARGLLELGPGTGRFAGTVLRDLAARGALPESYLLLEVGADLRERQPGRVRAIAGAAAARAHWLSALPSRFEGVVFGNEVLDALPCERFTLRDGVLHRLGVGLGADGRFGWRERVPDGSREGDDGFVATLEARLPPALREELPDGYTGEFQPAIGPWIAALGALLARGAVLLADYGLPRRQYYHPQRASGTLRCHYRHRSHDDPFVYPGLTDLSAWVDFTAVAEAADAAGLEVAGFATQAAVLLGGGIEARLATALERAGPDAMARATLARGARQLLMPGEMGESVKLMLLTRGIDAAAADAFRLQDLRRSL
jgi:SAM-dependent MidA family methyltransferase